MTEHQTKPIPASVRNLLKHPWIVDGYSAFDSNFTNEHRNRIGEPSYYYVRPEDKEPGVIGLTHNEAKSLTADDVFKDLAVVRDSGTVVINEHILHAINDFCRDVYSAWAKYTERLAEVGAVSPPPPHMTGDTP